MYHCQYTTVITWIHPSLPCYPSVSRLKSIYSINYYKSLKIQQNSQSFETVFLLRTKFFNIVNAFTNDCRKLNTVMTRTAFNSQLQWDSKYRLQFFSWNKQINKNNLSNKHMDYPYLSTANSHTDKKWLCNIFNIKFQNYTEFKCGFNFLMLKFTVTALMKFTFINFISFVCSELVNLCIFFVSCICIFCAYIPSSVYFVCSFV